ncbi:MAG: phosphatase PAP2 family protein [Acidobacteriota bacterium]
MSRQIGREISRIGSFVVILCTLAGPSAQGQTPTNSDPVELKSLPHQFIRDEARLWRSPFQKKNYDSHSFKKYVIPFAILSAAMLATDRKTSDAQPNTLDQTKWSGRVSDIGAWYSLLGFTGGSYLTGKFTGNTHAKEAGLLGMEALGHAQVVVFAMKEVANRERPLDHDGHGSFWEGGSSFPSGHSASAFAVATVYAYEYRDHIAVPIAAYSLASLVSASRLSARRHWVSDIFVGGSIGFLIGRFTYKRNHDPKLPGSPVSRQSRLIPDVGVGGANVVLTWRQ